MSQFRQAGQKRRGDLSDAFPKVGRCLKCFKHLIVDPDAQCIQMPGLKNCERCSGNGGKCALIPRTLSEACRAWEDQVDKWKAFLDAHPEIRTAREEDIDDPQPWTWEEWKRANKFTDSSRRVAVVRGEPDPWAGVPEEYRKVYNAGVTLITNISEELKKLSVPGASDSDNAMIVAVKELTAEIRACREVYMAVNHVVPELEERIPEEVARHFTSV